MGSTIFAEMSALAVRTGSVNLGQGFPDLSGPASVVEAAYDAMRAGRNQYPPGHGAPELVDAVIRHQQRHYGLELSRDQVVVTTGATEAIAGAMLGLVDPGDEVVVCEPYYDSYRAMIQFAGGVRRPVTLRAPDYRLDAAELEAAVTDRTRLILLNSPHNPTGRVLDAAELAAVADVAQRHDLVVVTDEVYEHLTFDDHAARPARHPAGDVRPDADHLQLGQDVLLHRLEDRLGHRAGRPGRGRRGRQELAVLLLGRAVPAGDRARARPRGGLPRAAARRPGPTSATTCARRSTRSGWRCTSRRAPTSSPPTSRRFGHADGIAFCAAMAERAQVVAIPTQVFYEDGSDDGRHLVRWAFCKEQDVLDEGIRRLRGADLHRRA